MYNLLARLKYWSIKAQSKGAHKIGAHKKCGRMPSGSDVQLFLMCFTDVCFSVVRLKLSFRWELYLHTASDSTTKRSRNAWRFARIRDKTKPKAKRPSQKQSHAKFGLVLFAVKIVLFVILIRALDARFCHWRWDSLHGVNSLMSVLHFC